VEVAAGHAGTRDLSCEQATDEILEERTAKAHYLSGIDRKWSEILAHWRCTSFDTKSSKELIKSLIIGNILVARLC
jgi:hypothetical protein